MRREPVNAALAPGRPDRALGDIGPGLRVDNSPTVSPNGGGA